MTQSNSRKPVQLHVDLDVDPSREQEMMENFHKIFEPAISQQPGFVEVKLLKLHAALYGEAPAFPGYRLVISFETEEQRLAWVERPIHQEVWPSVANCIQGTRWWGVLYDLV